MATLSIKQKNELYLEKMELTDKFLSLHEQLRKELDLASLCISKAKTTHGISLFSVNSVDTHDLEPSVRVEIDNGEFKILKEAEEDKSKEEESNDDENKEKSDETKTKNSGESEDVEDSETKKSPFHGQFRPFGVLEPKAAKDARNVYKNAIQIIVNLVTIQQSIRAKSRELIES
uniref:Vacuolar ATPase assembly protein VMA22 n=1 Tax=Caenorhabditis tropicalis TaxID=1561998 RepID=A0A1I7U495_9PELO